MNPHPNKPVFAAESEIAAKPIAAAMFELQPAEVVVLDLRPPLVRSLIAEATAWFAAAAGIMLVFLAAPASLLAWAKPLFPLAAIIALVPIVRGAEPWARRRYILTDRRVIAISGHLVELTREKPLSAIRRLRLSARRGQRVAGLHTLAFEDASGEVIEWANITGGPHVEEVARETIRRYARGALEE